MSRPRGNRLVQVSGQVGADESGAIVAGGLAGQTERALLNVASAVETAGARVEDLTRMRIYVVGWTPSMWEAFNQGAQAAYRQRPFPEVAATLVGVTSLFTPEMLVEIEADAIADLSAARPPDRSPAGMPGRGVAIGAIGPRSGRRRR